MLATILYLFEPELNYHNKHATSIRLNIRSAGLTANLGG